MISRKVADFVRPMLARETDKPFNDPEWIFEIKWDGYRAIAELDGSVRLYSRNGNSFNELYPVIVEELVKLKLRAIIDGEVVAFDDKGRPSFQLLQDYQRNPVYPLCYYVFDLLALEGRNTCDLPLVERKELLRRIIGKSPVIRYADHIEAKGRVFFSRIRQMDMEGIMAKKADSRYYPGRRTSEWLKIKHSKTRDAVIAGFTEPGGARKYFGALVLGIYDGGRLKYMGHTGSGFNDITLRETATLLEPLIIPHSPFDEAAKTNMPVSWVRPELVCEIKYTEQTRDGRLRHPIFLHLRKDKKAKEVTMASETTIPEKVARKRPVKKNDRQIRGKRNTVSIRVSRIEVPVTNLDKVFWPEEGITKGDVINYYISIADHIMPYLKGRPQSLKRNPNGIRDEGFFHKDAGDEAPEWVESVKIYSESTGKDIDYILCNNKATLTYLNNLGCIELNPWNSTTAALDHPDYLIIDIDPSDKNSFGQVIETARAFHDILEKVRIPSYCKTSGATGLHIFIPMGKKYAYDQVRGFAHLLCMMAHDRLPAFTSLERNLKKRGSMIYLDHLQNRRGQTLASVYSLRPKQGATVSFPLEWKQVKPGLSPQQFNIHNVPRIIKKSLRIFSGVLGKGIDMKKSLDRLTRT
ncbi:MAG: DNA ligase D [Bacteroidota bacterium]